MCSLQVIRVHRDHVQQCFPLHFGSNKFGPIRCFFLPPQVSPDCDDQANLSSARLHLGSCPAVGPRITFRQRIVACSWHYCLCHRSYRRLCCLYQDLPPIASSADSTPSSQPSAATSREHTEHGEVQENSVRHDVDLRASHGLLCSFLVCGYIQISDRKDSPEWVFVGLQLLACIAEFSLEPFRLPFAAAWIPLRSRETAAQTVLPIQIFLDELKIASRC